MKRKASLPKHLSLGRPFGIETRIHWSFFLLPAWVGAMALLQGTPLAGILALLLFVAGIFACVVLHELGHCLAARFFGIGTKDITLWPIGGVARLERMPGRWWEELVIALAGPAVNVGIAIVLAPLLFLTGVPESLPVIPASFSDFLARMIAANIFLAIFNLLPAFPMDGGRVLRALLAARKGQLRATQIAAGVGKGMAVLFGLAGLFLLGSPILVVIAVFIFLGAEAERRAAGASSALSGRKVSEIMNGNPTVCGPDATVEEALWLAVRASQESLPVVERGAVRGVVAKFELTEAMKRLGGDLPVSQLLDGDLAVARNDDPLDRAAERLAASGQAALPVIGAAGDLEGLLEAQNVAAFVSIVGAADARWRSFPPSANNDAEPQPA